MKKIIIVVFTLLAITTKAQPIIEKNVLIGWGPNPPESSDIVVPNGVLKIARDAFGYISKVTSVSIPVSVIKIEPGALSRSDILNINADPGSPYFSSLDGVLFNKDQTSLVAYPGGKTATSYQVSGTVKVISSKAFNGTVLTSIDLPGVTTIEKDAFGCPKLTSVNFSNSLVTIGERAFACVSLTSLNLPSSLTYIGDYAFCGIPITSLVIPPAVSHIGDGAFSSCNNLENINFSNSNSLTWIGSNAFYNCKITSVTLPNSVKYLGSQAFYNCLYLLSVNLPNQLDSISGGLFQKCIALKDIVIPPHVKRIGGDAFEGCFDLTNISLPEGVLSIGRLAFGQCTELKQINIPSSVTNIEEQAFQGAGLTTFPVINVSVLNKGVFAGCNFTSVNIPSCVTAIDQGAFFTCGLIENVTIQNSVKTIGRMAFADCFKLNSINIPNSVTYIGEQAFARCRQLPSIIIPNSVKEIGSFAFEECKSLTSFVVPNSITTLNSGLFLACNALTNIDIPSSVTTVKDSVFWGCMSLPPSFKLPESIKNSGDTEFGFCHSFTDVIVFPWASIIPTTQFYNCKGLVNIHIPEGITIIGSAAFERCANLKTVSFPSTLKEIWYAAFNRCTSMESIVLPEGLEKLEATVFYQCNNLKTVTIGSKLTNINLESFNTCPNLTTLDFSNNSTIDTVYYELGGHEYTAKNFNPSLVIYLANEKLKKRLEDAGFKVVIGKPVNITFNNLKYAINKNVAVLSVTLLSSSSVELKEVGFAISKKTLPTTKDIKILGANAIIGDISAECKELQTDSMYYARAFATDNNEITVYSNEISFQVPSHNVPATQFVPIFASIPDNVTAQVPIKLSLEGDLQKVFESGIWKVNDVVITAGIWIPEKAGVYIVKLTSADGKATIEKRIIVK